MVLLITCRAMIDLRSDTVTRPTQAMRAAMAAAEVGDDVYGDDPTILALESKVASLLDKSAAVFVPSGTQSNLIALMAHCQRGDEYIVGQLAHTYKYEAGGGAILGSLQPQPIVTEPDGTLDLDRVASVIKPDDDHFANTRLLCLENTYQGKALPVGYFAEMRRFADHHGLATHLDGARLWNAAVATGETPAHLGAAFDSVSVCLSKGLGAPIGSVLVGDDALIRRARRWRKMVGGGMRQAGVIAAAGIYALDHHFERLAEDHRNASALASGLAALSGVRVVSVDTNAVFADLGFSDPGLATTALRDRGILATVGPRVSRLVTHLDVSSADVESVIDAVVQVRTNA